MGRKRKYYREDRRPIRYREDDYDDWDDEEEDEPLDGDKVLRRGSMGILIVLLFGILLWATQFFYTPSAQSALSGRYEVVSVSHGKLHTIELATGRQVSFTDQDLVRKALHGDLKRGDVFYR